MVDRRKTSKGKINALKIPVCQPSCVEASIRNAKARSRPKQCCIYTYTYIFIYICIYAQAAIFFHKPSASMLVQVNKLSWDVGTEGSGETWEECNNAVKMKQLLKLQSFSISRSRYHSCIHFGAGQQTHFSHHHQGSFSAGFRKKNEPRPRRYQTSRHELSFLKNLRKRFGQSHDPLHRVSRQAFQVLNRRRLLQVDIHFLAIQPTASPLNKICWLRSLHEPRGTTSPKGPQVKGFHTIEIGKGQANCFHDSLKPRSQGLARKRPGLSRLVNPCKGQLQDTKDIWNVDLCILMSRSSKPRLWLRNRQGRVGNWPSGDCRNHFARTQETSEAKSYGSRSPRPSPK